MLFSNITISQFDFKSLFLGYVPRSWSMMPRSRHGHAGYHYWLAFVKSASLQDFIRFCSQFCQSIKIFGYGFDFPISWEVLPTIPCLICIYQVTICVYHDTRDVNSWFWLSPNLICSCHVMRSIVNLIKQRVPFTEYACAPFAEFSITIMISWYSTSVNCIFWSWD